MEKRTYRHISSYVFLLAAPLYIAWSFPSRKCVKFDYLSTAFPVAPSQEIIQTYLWPALLEGKDGPCVQKGVVVT